MSCQSDDDIDEGDAALQPPSYSSPTKPNRNDGAGHAESNAEGTNAEFAADAEKQFVESTGKKRKSRYHLFLEYRFIEEWATGQHATLEPAEIKHAIKMHMKKFMQDSRLMVAPATGPEKKRLTLPSGSSNTPNITTRELKK